MEKKPYKKPTLNKVKLVPEEAVLGVCKNDLGAGPNQSQCIVPQCFNEGSWEQIENSNFSKKIDCEDI